MTTHNAIVAYSRERAEDFIEAFDLSVEDWDALYFRQPIRLRGYDKVVVVRPHWQMSVEDNEYFEKWLQVWRSHVRPGGDFQVL
jgi:hypothetical protein